MRLVIQRVSSASVSVGGEIVGAIDMGLMVLVGVEKGDTPDDARWLAAKTASMRVFDDDNGVMNCSVCDVNGNVLSISQFTLTASTRKGNRPSYIRAAGRELAIELWNLYSDLVSEAIGHPVERGVFGADMQVSLTNSGPVTIIIDSRNSE